MFAKILKIFVLVIEEFCVERLMVLEVIVNVPALLIKTSLFPELGILNVEDVIVAVAPALLVIDVW